MKKLISAWLVVCLLIGCLPVAGIAEANTALEAAAEPVVEPTPEPTEEPTPEPTEEPTPEPTEEPTPEPTEEPTPEPTEEPTPEPTEEPTPEPTEEPTPEQTEEPTAAPTEEPTEEPTAAPIEEPTAAPTEKPTAAPTEKPTATPTEEPTAAPTEKPTEEPTALPTAKPSLHVSENLEFFQGYVRLLEKADAYETASDTQRVLTVRRDELAYAVSRPNPGESKDRLELVFNVDGKAVFGFVEARYLEALETEEEEKIIREMKDSPDAIEAAEGKPLAVNTVTLIEEGSEETTLTEEGSEETTPPEEGSEETTLTEEEGEETTPPKDESEEATPAEAPTAEPEEVPVVPDATEPPAKTAEEAERIQRILDSGLANVKTQDINLSVRPMGSNRLPESDHPYDDYYDNTWLLYSEVPAAAISITFSSDTYVENGCDFIILYNAKEGKIGEYTGSELQGRTITVPGDKIYIRLVSDYSLHYYGFSLVDANILDSATIESITTVSGPKAKIQWEAPYTAAGYQLQRAVVDRTTGESGAFYTISSGSGTSYTDANVTPGMLYSYRVRFYKTLKYKGRSYRYYSGFGYKRHYVARTPQISGGFGSKWYQGIVINWKAVKGANGYIVYRSNTANGTYSRIGETTGTSYTDMVSERKSYYYKIRAKATVDGANYLSAASTGKVLGYVGTPTNVRASGVNSSTVKLQWNAVAGATGYAIYRSTNPDTGFTWLKASTSTSTTNSVPTKGRVYYYRVRAYNAKEQYSDFSATAAVLPMSAPTGLRHVSHTKTSVSVAWNAVPGASYYKVFRSYNGTKWPVSAEVRGTSYNFTNLEESYQYSYFIVKAYRDIDVNGSISTCMSVGSNTLRVEKNMVNFRYLGIIEEDFPDPDDDRPSNGQNTRLLRGILGKASPYGRPIASGNIYMNQSRSSIMSRIDSALAAKADSNDISLFYIHCHGDNSKSTGYYAGALYLSDDKWILMDELANKLKTVPGRVIVIIDSCGSGAAILANAANAQSEFNNMAIAAFENADEEIIVEETFEGDDMQPMHGEFRVANKFYVITSAMAGTYGWSQGDWGTLLLQWMNAGVMGADSNGDGTVVLREMQSYLTRRGRNKLINGQYHMYPQVYPENSSFPIFKRR